MCKISKKKYKINNVWAALAQILFEIFCTQYFQILFSKGQNTEKGHDSKMTTKYGSVMSFYEESVYKISFNALIFPILRDWLQSVCIFLSDLSLLPPLPRNFILLIIQRRCCCCVSIYFVFWGRIIVLFELYVRFHSFS